MRTVGADVIRKQLAKYIKSLKEGDTIHCSTSEEYSVLSFLSSFLLDFTQGMILPKKESGAKNGEVVQAPKQPGVKLPTSTSTPDIKHLQIGVKIDIQSYDCTQNFKCPPVEIYNVLTQPELLRAFTSAPTQVDASPGGKFALFDGNITGQFLELVNAKMNTPMVKFIGNWETFIDLLLGS